MSRFSECFFLVFGQLAAGGALALAVPPFRVLDRGFYRSSGGIFAGFALAFALAYGVLNWQVGGLAGRTGVELALWGAFAALFTAYVALLWGERALLRARLYSASLLLGVLALWVSAGAFVPPSFSGAITWVYPLPFLTAAASLGAVATGMLLGHWYLIDLGLSIDPLARLLRFFMWTTALHLVVLGLVLGSASASGGPAAEAAAALFTEHRALFAARVLLGPVPALAIAWLIHRTLQIPQTMAATGLFYVAILFVMVGEMLGRLVLYQTGLPL
ncbi:MAG TPA: hypothetical protein VNO26_00885 [Candidatus Limnocylindria bacterium]|nr:hypothetical protein [Candidatus Limnocylindria bacterium]